MNFNATKLLRYGLILGTWLFIVIYLWIAVQRMQYPFELEWIEGGMFSQVQRILNRQDVYAAPNMHFIPFLYPPLYFYLSAAASLIFGSSLFSLRLVSFLASLASFTIIALISYQETKNWRIGLFTAGFFAATYRLSGAFLDIARVDSLFLAAWLAFVYFSRYDKKTVHAIVAGIFGALAFLTKQTALIAVFPVILYWMWRNWKQGLTMLGVAISLIGITTIFFNLASDGWYSYYIFNSLTKQTQWLTFMIVPFWTKYLLSYLPFAILFTISFFVLAGSDPQDRPARVFWLSVLIGATATSYLGLIKAGGYDNVLLPVYAALSVFWGFGFQKLLGAVNHFGEQTKSKMEVIFLAGCLLQLVMLLYNPFAQIPSAADVKAGEKLVQFISEIDGSVYVAHHGYLAARAGKESFAHESAIWDVMRGDYKTLDEIALQQELDDAIRAQEFDAIILDKDLTDCCRLLSDYYTLASDSSGGGNGPYTFTGWLTRPTYFYFPNGFGN